MKWLFFTLDPSTAKIIFFFALFALFGTLFAFVFVLIGLMNALSYLGYYQTMSATVGSTNYAAVWGSNVVLYYVLELAFVAFLLLFLLITVVQCSKARNY